MGVWVYGCTGVQVYSHAGIQVYRCTGMAKNEITAVTIRIQRCTCAVSAQLRPSTFNVAVMAKR